MIPVTSETDIDSECKNRAGTLDVKAQSYAQFYYGVSFVLSTLQQPWLYARYT